MSTEVYERPDESSILEVEVDEGLRAISSDLSIGLIQDVTLQAYEAHVVSTSRFAPVNAMGTEMYIRTTELLRERLSAMGWRAENHDEVPSISDPLGKIRIVCRTSSDGSTGMKSQSGPRLRKVGKGTLRLAGFLGNTTLPFPGFESLVGNDGPSRLDNLDFYYLLVHIDQRREEIRLELPSPFFSNKGEHLGWKFRLLLPAVTLTHKVDIDLTTAPTPDIKVNLKMA